MNIFLKLKLIVLIVLVIASGIVNSSFESYNLKDNRITDNYFEKFSGEKTFLTNQTSYQTGAWGTLKLVPFIIQPSLDFISKQTNLDELSNMFESSCIWKFKNTTYENLNQIFISSGIDEKTRKVLLSNTKAFPEEKGYVTKPPDSVLWNLTQKVREKLYPFIAKDEENIMYYQPVSFNSSSSDEWFFNCKLSKELKEKLKSLVYVINGISYISDVDLVLQMVKNDDEKMILFQTLFRTKSLELYLEIKQNQNICEIADYWGNLGRINVVKPILEDMSKKKGGGEVNISEFLPTIPKNRLNTYSGKEEYSADYKDCHWTTINFFNDKIDERYYDMYDFYPFIKSISKLSDNTHLKFGDIISVFDKNDNLTHSCTYIADNLVMTKNGMGNLKPFVITYLDNTINLYGDKTVYLSRTTSNTNIIKTV